LRFKVIRFFDLSFSSCFLIRPHHNRYLISNYPLYILTELSLKNSLSLHSIFTMRSSLSTVVALASAFQLASAVCLFMPSICPP
jgi:hypothetical protein